MKPKSAENRLIKDIKILIEDFTSSSINISEAKEKFTAFSKQYELLRTQNLNHNNTDILKSICYQHNCSNFSIFTGIFMIFNNQILKLNYSGNSAIGTKILKILSNSFEMDYNKIKMIESDSGKYFAVKFIHNNEDLILVSQSSSVYFSKEKFKELFNKLKIILPVESKSTEDIFAIYEKVMKYIDQNCNEDYILCCYIYSFPELYYIFGHMGDNFMKTLESKLITIMEHDFPESKVFQISDNDYIVLEIKEKNINLNNEISAPKIFFASRNIPIPFNTHALYIFEKTDFFKVLNLCGKKQQTTGKTRC